MEKSVLARPTCLEPNKGSYIVFLSTGSPEGVSSDITTTIQEPRLKLSLKGPASLMVLVLFIFVVWRLLLRRRFSFPA